MAPNPRSISPFLVVLLLLAPGLGAQQVTGRVTNGQTGAPLGAVQVYVAGSGIGALTQNNGRYLLLNVPAGTHTLTVERIGYGRVTRDVTVSAGQTVVEDFTLTEQALGLDEIVVTGTAGGGRQREVGAAVSRVDSDILRMGAPASLQGALQGQASGLIMNQGSPQPGAAASLVLRGTNSISQGNEPLIYVDGVRIFGKAANTSTSGSNQDYNPLGNIRPQDIERVEIVRGPAATTLYGTEASGGVIQIFTRRGITGAPQWTAEVSAGFASQGHVGPSAEDGNSEGFGFNNCSDRVTSLGVSYADVTCGDDGDFLKAGPIQRYNLAVQGGTAGFTYALSGNLRDESAPYDASGIGNVRPEVQVDRPGYVRDGGVRANFSFNLTPTLSAQWSSSLNVGTTRWVPAGSNGSWMWTISMSRGPSGVIKSDGQPASALAMIMESYDRKRQVTTGFIVDYKPSDRLNHRLSIGYDLNQNIASLYAPVGFWNFPTGDYHEVNWTHGTTSFDYGANFRASLKNGDVTSTSSVGFQAYQDVDRRFRLRVREFPAPADVPTFVFGSQRNVEEDEKLRVINAGFYFQQMFGYKDYLFLTGGLRLDGNSAFGESFGLQPYPKLSASLILSDMEFWPTDWFESFKLRAAVGEAGKAPGAFDAVRSWSPIAGDGGKPGFTPSTLGNPELGPERTREYEIGFDASLYEGRITAEVTAFHQRTSDALVPVSPIPSLGFGSAQLTNIGLLQNQGGEISVDLGVIRRPNLGWDVGFMFSQAKSKAVDLDGLEVSLDSWAGVREGYPVPSYFANKIVNADEYADPIIETDQYLGPTVPERTINVRTMVTLWNRLSISALGEYQAGGFMENQTSYRMAQRNVFGPCFEAQQALRAAAAGDASALNGTTAELRAKCTVVPTQQLEQNWIEAADFFKLRSVTMSYQIPEGLLPRTQSATLTLSGANLWKSTDYWGTDPEARNRGAVNDSPVDYHSLAPYRTFVASLSVRF